MLTVNKNNLYSSFICYYDNNNNMTGGEVETKKRYLVSFKAKEIIKHKSKYIKFSQNQLQILDALLNDGSQKKYIDASGDLRYSEHSGLFDFDKSVLERIVVSGKTNREDNDDIDILLPQNMEDALDYEYIFHTHPPTPYPGARAIGGILYEFPSIADLFHFAYHYNEGHVQGSMIVAPEGIYIIRLKENVKYLDYPSNKIAKKMEEINIKIQDMAIEKYGTDYSNHRQKIFYENVAQDRTYIKIFNKMVKKYFNDKMIVSYKPREHDRTTGKWIIKNLYIKIEPIQIKYS
jgi:hypothetical protein